VIDGSFPEAPVTADLSRWNLAFPNELMGRRFGYLQMDGRLFDGQEIPRYLIHPVRLSGRTAKFVPECIRILVQSTIAAGYYQTLF